MLLHPVGDQTAQIDDVERVHAPGRTAGTFIRRRLDRAGDALAANFTALLLTFDDCLVALDDDLEADI